MYMYIRINVHTLQDEHRLVRRTTENKGEKSFVSRQREEEDMQEYIEQKHICRLDRTKKTRFEFMWVWLRTSFERNRSSRLLLLLLLLQFVLKFQRDTLIDEVGQSIFPVFQLGFEN